MMTAKKTTATKTLTADDASRRVSLRLYGDCGHNYLAYHAESELQGRSHYYDKSTRKGFGSRVNHLAIERGGLLLCTVESVAHPTEGRVHRAVVHDLSGEVIYRSCEDEEGRSGFKAGKSAVADLRRWLDEYCDEATEAARVLAKATEAARRELERMEGGV